MWQTASTNTMTQLAFDYQDMKYRNMLVEFEVTKEPEGTRVLFSTPVQNISQGLSIIRVEKWRSRTRPISDSYYLHTDPTDTENRTQGERLDVHMGFKAGGGQSVSRNSMLLYAFFAVAGLYACICQTQAQNVKSMRQLQK